MRSSSRAAALALAAACGQAAGADPAPASPALCSPQQRVMFHCDLGKKAVSLCAGMKDDRIAVLEYRYGAPGRIETTYAAHAAGGPGFSASVAQLEPRASVRQLWFTRDGFTYLLSQCVGGACPHSAGLSVLRGEHVVSNRSCLRSADDRAWFSPELARFASDAANSRSSTEFVIFDDVDNGIERLYPPHR